MLNVKPVVNDIKKIDAADKAGTPIEIKIGNTIEPTMMMEPSPLNVVKSNATATQRINVTTNGLSPPNSADFLMIFSVIPVLFIN